MAFELLQVALAALLHDIGKFWQRAGEKGDHASLGARFVEEFSFLFPLDWLDDLGDAVANHHRKQAHKDIEKIVQVADRLAAKEREEAKIERRNPAETPLVPVTATVDIGRGKTPFGWGYVPMALSLDPNVIFPKPSPTVSEDDYRKLWEEDFVPTLQLLKGKGPVSFPTLLALLERYTTFMPSATPWEEDEEHRTYPDISLFSHLRASAAIAACLTRLMPDELDALHRNPKSFEKSVALMVRADFSGIQKFIYRITATRVDGTFEGASKRLRGRSFYLTVLYEVVAEWLVRNLGLTQANILFCGGGRFDLLAPSDSRTQEKLAELEKELQSWLLGRFHGELGVQIAVQDVHVNDFGDLRQVFNALDDELAEKKRRKFEPFVIGQWSPPHQGEFFAPVESYYHVCNVCKLTPLDEAGICPFCREHSDIGYKLPRSCYIAFLYGWESHVPKRAKLMDFEDGAPFGVKVALLDEGDFTRLLRNNKGEGEAVIYRVNDTDFIRDDVPSNVSLSFKFLANAAPVAREPLPATATTEEVGEGDVLNFDRIASMSTGAELLGVLKADVDYLGLVFAEGIKASISRVATLSRSMELFFAGWLDKLCRDMAERWHSDPENESELKGKVDGLFYITYSGGDDLLLMGPWDQVVKLAVLLNEDFMAYCCGNPNLTLSAGIITVKPQFPIQRFTALVGEELERAKVGRNRVTAFGHTVVWREPPPEEAKGFDRLIRFGEALADKVKVKELPRSLLHFLFQLHEAHFTEEGENPMWIPKLHYIIARRLRKEVIAELDLVDKLVSMREHLVIPCAYAILKTRERR